MSKRGNEAPEAMESNRIEAKDKRIRWSRCKVHGYLDEKARER